MEIEVKVKEILKPYEYTRFDGAKILVKSFIGVTQGDYPQAVKFNVSRDGVFERMGIEVGSVYNVAFNLSSRMGKNGGWYTNVEAWHVRKVVKK